MWPKSRLVDSGASVTRLHSSANANRIPKPTRSHLGFASLLSGLSKDCSMEFEESDFIRNPVVQNEIFFLESKCVSCRLSILAQSIEELVELEELHRRQCRPVEPRCMTG